MLHSDLTKSAFLPACNCHGHAADCYYDPDVEQQQASLNTKGTYAGGGVCIDCQVRGAHKQVSTLVLAWNPVFK